MTDFGCLSNKNYEYNYFPIVKNAHSWGTLFFKKHYNFNYSYDLNLFDNKFIVFVREPINRWYSGVVQWIAFQTLNGKKLSEDFVLSEFELKIIFSAVTVDAHSTTQCTFLNKLDFNKCKFFDMDSPDFSKNLKHFLENHMGKNITDSDFEKYHVITDMPLKVNLKKQLQNAYNNDTIFQKQLLDYHKNDLSTYYRIKEKHLYEIK